MPANGRKLQIWEFVAVSSSLPPARSINVTGSSLEVASRCKTAKLGGLGNSSAARSWVCSLTIYRVPNGILRPFRGLAKRRKSFDDLRLP
jgi:hypothetical protein